MFLKYPDETLYGYNTIPEVALYLGFQEYEDAIDALHTRQWKEEDVRGESCKQYDVLKYHWARLAVRLFKNLSDGGMTWVEIAETYNLVEMSEKFACDNIDIDPLLTIYGLPTIHETINLLNDNPTDIEGIEGMAVQSTFVVEPGDYDYTSAASVVPYATIIADSDTCTVDLETDCPLT